MSWRSGDIDKAKLSQVWHPFAPAHATESLLDVNLDHLYGRGKRLLLLDVDHTLVEWRSEHISPETIAWVQKAKDLGFDICIISNTKKVERLHRLKDKLGVETVRGTFKPSRAMFRLALIKFKCRPEDAIMIGDQLMTDVLGANRSGIDAIWVRKMDGKEFSGTRINRFVEGLLKGPIYKALVVPENRPLIDPEHPTTSELTIVKQISRFVIVGGTSFVIDALLTVLLMKGIHVGGEPLGMALGKHLQTSYPSVFAFADAPDKAAAPILGGLASFVAMFNSFIWNRAWTFEARGKDRKAAQVLRFYLISIFGAFLNSGLFGVFYNALHGILAAKVFSAGIVAVWNFLGQRYFAFRAKNA